MTNAASLSSSARPLALLGTPLPFGVAPPSIGSRRSVSTPSWTRLTGDEEGGAAEGVASLDQSDQNGTSTSNATAGSSANGDAASAQPSSADGLAPTYSSPEEASAAYRSGLLKSDCNISGSNPSIRLAFRYLLQDEREGKSEDREGKRKESGEELLYLCWIRQDGMPFHFRPMRPVNNTAMEGEDVATGGGHGNLRGSANESEDLQPPKNDTSAMLVNENDRIETTFPGHAFVFCRRVEYKYNHRNGDDGEAGSGEDPIVINDDDGRTYFLRRKKRDGEEDKGGSKEERNEEDEDAWEAYLVVGGFRPNPMPADEDSSIEAENDAGDTMNGDNDETGTADDESDNGSDSGSEDSFDAQELMVQLVTIHSARISPKAASAAAAREMETDHEEDNLPSRLLGCSDCAEAVPFLRGAMNPKPRHTPAFMATKSNNNDGGAEAGSVVPVAASGSQANSGGYAMIVTVCVTQLDPTPLDTSSKHYDEVILGGWPCRCEPGCFPADMDIPENGRNLLRSRYEADLAAAAECLPPAAREKLKRSTPIWINKSQSFGPKAAPIKGRDGCFHPGAGWLRRNGMNPAKCGGVEWYDAKHYLSDCDLWGPGGLQLHELSHAWHCLHVEHGYDNADVFDTWQRAMEEGLYDCVRVHGPQGPMCKAYACTNAMEYFAELSVAFLGGLDEEREHNKWYPFNRAQVREHDPRAFAMLCRIWGVDVDVDGAGGEQASGHVEGGEGSRES